MTTIHITRPKRKDGAGRDRVRARAQPASARPRRRRSGRLRGRPGPPATPASARRREGPEPRRLAGWRATVPVTKPRRQHGARGQSVRDLERCAGEGDGEGAARSARLSGRDRIEAEMLSGDSVRDPADAASALSKIGGRIKSVIVTLGGQGLVIKSADDTISTISAKRVKLVSSHGAGDCFVGALAAKVADGASLTQAADSRTL